MAAGAESLRHHRRLRFRHRLYARAHDADTIRAAARRRASPHAAPVVQQGHGSALRRESAPEGRHVRRRLGRGRRATAASFRAKSFPTTISSTCKPPGIWRRNSTSRPAPSSSTPIPAAASTGETLAEAYSRRWRCDPVSAFGGVIGVNRPIDARGRGRNGQAFLEVIAAPGFDEAAARHFRNEEEPAPGRDHASAAGVGCSRTSPAAARPGCRLTQLKDSDLKVVSQAPAHAGRNARAAVRLDGLQAREVQRHCLCARRPNRWRGRRPDEPRGFLPKSAP